MTFPFKTFSFLGISQCHLWLPEDISH
jgi:hypothetical protein